MGVAGRVPIDLRSGLAVTPWATTLSRTVQPAATIIVSLPGRLSSKTRIAKTIVASPRGLAHAFRAAQKLLLVTLVE
jgi:hypothetical protein